MESGVVIDLNGYIITGRVDGLEDISVTRAKKEKGGATTSYSNELTFYDDGYNILKAELLDHPDGFNRVVYVKIYDECCSQVVFHGQIMGNAVDWCYPDCAITANIAEVDEALSCIQNTLLTVNDFGRTYHQYRAGQQIHYPIRYCVISRPIFNAALISLFGTILQFIVSALALIAIVATAGLLWKKIKKLRDDINSQLGFCGNMHPSSYVIDYIKNVCQHCGLQFESSIFDANSAYKDLMLISTFPQKGLDFTFNNVSLIYQNEPVETLETLFDDYLAPMFNADYKIVGNKLIFERKDYFQNISQWLDANQLLDQGRIIDGKICYSWIDQERWSYGDFKWSSDTIDLSSNDADWEDIVEWNPPAYPAGQVYSAAQKKAKELQLLSGMATPVYYQQGYSYIQDASQNKEALSMSQHSSAIYKFAIVRESDALNGRIMGPVNFNAHNYTDQFMHINGTPNIPWINRINYPLWFREGIDGLYGYQNNLYSRFHYIDNPRWPGALQFNFEFTFEYKCDELLNFGFEKNISLYVANQYRNGIVDEIIINYINRTIQVKGRA